MKILKSLNDQEIYLEKRKNELGITSEMMIKCRNSGSRRTESKKNLLKFLASRMKIKPWWYEGAGEPPCL